MIMSVGNHDLVCHDECLFVMPDTCSGIQSVLKDETHIMYDTLKEGNVLLAGCYGTKDLRLMQLGVISMVVKIFPHVV